MDYLYTIQDSGKEYYISVTEMDCPSKAEIIRAMVQELKSQVKLPLQMNETTTWDNVFAYPNSIRYYYTLTELDIDDDGSSGSDIESKLKSRLQPTLCLGGDTRGMLDQEIAMEYSYTIEDSGQTHFVSVTKADCL